MPDARPIIHVPRYYLCADCFKALAAYEAPGTYRARYPTPCPDCMEREAARRFVGAAGRRNR